MIDLGAAYSNKRVVVFGASGFIGAHLVKMALPLARSVVAFAKRNAVGTRHVPEGAEIISGDIRSEMDVRQACLRADVVFVLAGRSGAVESLEDPLTDLLVNCGGLLNILHVLQSRGCEVRTVFPGSRLEYGKPEHSPTSEDDALLPLEPYGLHRIFCEQYLEFYARRFGMKYAVARLTNVYGPREGPPSVGFNLLNSWISRAVAGGTLEIYGNGKQLRDYIFVEDAVRLLLLLGAVEENTIVNGGSGEGRPLKDVAKLVVKLAGSGRIEHVPWPQSALQIETGDFVADVSRARVLGWQPTTELETGIEFTVECERSFVAESSSRAGGSSKGRLFI